MKILRIDPIFDNEKLIGKLGERGLLIQGEDMDGIRRVEKEIDEMKT